MIVAHLAWREMRAVLSTGRFGWILMFWLVNAGLFWFAMVNNYALQSQDLVFNPYAAQMLNLGEYLIAPWFGNMLIICLLIGPVLAVRMFTEEYRHKTIELLLTSPIHAWEIVLGKYLGAMGLVGLLLLSTAHVPISLYRFADPDPGLFAGGYLMLGLVMSVVISLTLLVSSFTESQMVAMFISMVAALVLYLISWLADDPDGVMAQLSLASHVEDVLRGSLRLSDLAWFGAATAFFLFATHQRLESFRWS